MDMTNSIRVVVLAVCVTCTLSKCLFGDPEHCVFQCHCGGDGLCDSRTGQCFQGQCRTDQSMLGTGQSQNEAKWAWLGPACQVGNVAFGKKAISNDHSAMMGEWAELNDMTDGISRSSTRTCPVIWTMSSQPAAWLIDLEVPHKITGFTLYVFSRAVGKLKVTVGNSTSLSDHTTCAQLKSKKGVDRKLYAELNCTTDLIGQYVSVVKNPDTDDHPDSLDLCEIAVTGHKYMDVDWTKCMDQSFNEIWCGQCQNSLPPACAEPCRSGKYGLNCKMSCEPCNGECNSQTGKCMGDGANPTEKPKVTETISNNSDTNGIDGVVFTAHNKDFANGHSNDDVTESSTDPWDHTDIDSMVSINLEDTNDYVYMTDKPNLCAEGYFGYNCSTSCGMCSKKQYCDMTTGKCPDGCEDWYRTVNHDCDTAIPKINLNQDNIRVTSLPDGFRLQIIELKNIDPLLTENYKGELKYSANDGSNKLNSQRYMMNFYPINGSLETEVVVDRLKTNSIYDISVLIFRTLDGRTSAGSAVSTSIVTSKVKALPRQHSGMDTTHYSFIIMLAVLVTLVICVTGTIVYLCLRARKRKSLDDSRTETDSSSDFLKETPIYLTKTEPDPIYHFIDDGGDNRYHLYHDINDFSHERSQNFSNNNALKRFSLNVAERDGFIQNNARMRNSYVPEMNELCEFRPPHCLNNEKLNQDYLTTASLQANYVTNTWGAQTKHPSTPSSAASEPPRYIKASQQGTASHPYPTHVNLHHHQLPQHQPIEENDYLMPRADRRESANQMPDYMIPVNHYPRATDGHQMPVSTSGYIPMDSPTEQSHMPRYSMASRQDGDEPALWDHQHNVLFDESNSEESSEETGSRPPYQSYVHMA